MCTSPPSPARAVRLTRAARSRIVTTIAAIAVLGLAVSGCGEVDIAAPSETIQRPTPAFEEPAPPPEVLSMVTTEEQSLAAGVNNVALKSHLDQWLASHDVDGAVIGVGFPDGSIAIVVSGDDSEGNKFEATDTFLATSVTKTMTAALVLDLGTKQRLGIDQQAPTLREFPEFGHAGAMTIRQLLQHTSGLIPYQRSDVWSSSVAITPIEALGLADDKDLEWEPGTTNGYSNSGYIYLGLIAEEVTGRPFEALLDELVVEPLGLTETKLDDVARPGWVGYSAGGLVSNIPDLVRWGAALYRDGLILEPDALESMLNIDNEHKTGLGANPVCPCGRDDNGDPWYTSIGHDGGSVTVQFSPADQFVIAAKFSESFWTDELAQTEVHKLLADMRVVATTASTGLAFSAPGSTPDPGSAPDPEPTAAPESVADPEPTAAPGSAQEEESS